jgi:hypothetical protein
MEYVTRQLAAIRKEILDTLKTVQRNQEQSAAAIRSVRECYDSQNRIWEQRFEHLQPKENSKRDDRDYRVQNSIRWAAWLAFLAATVYGYVSYRQWNTAKETLQVQTRPWVGGDGESRLTVNDVTVDKANNEIVDTKAEFNIKNYGQSPALRVAFSSQPFVLLWPGKESQQLVYRKARETVCTQADKLATFGGISLFPQQPFTFRSSGQAPAEGIRKVGFVTVIACLSYRDHFDDTPLHHTTLCLTSPTNQLGTTFALGCNGEEITN